MDGGINWKEIAKGPHLFSAADHGAIILKSKLGAPTNYVEYSINFGKVTILLINVWQSWTKLYFLNSSESVNILRLISHPLSNS